MTPSPDTFLELNPDEWAAVASVFTALVALAAVLIAARQLRLAQNLRREQAQPYVVVSIEQAGRSDTGRDLVVRNLGQTAAFDVTLTPDPAPLLQSFDDGDRTLKLPVLSTLVPGQEWRTFWDSTHLRIESDVPQTYEIRVDFRDARKKLPPLTYTLDWAAEFDRGYIVQKDAAASLEKIEKHMSQWRTAGRRGITVDVRERSSE